MDPAQIEAVNNHKSGIIGCIEAHLNHMLIDFTEDGAGPKEMRVLSSRNRQSIQAHRTPYEQAIELINMLKQSVDGFVALTTALRRNGRKDLAATLEKDSSNNLKSSSEVPAVSSAGTSQPLHRAGTAPAMTDKQMEEHLERTDVRNILLKKLDVEHFALYLSKIDPDLRHKLVHSSEMSLAKKVSKLLEGLVRKVGALAEFYDILQQREPDLYREIMQCGT